MTTAWNDLTVEQLRTELADHITPSDLKGKKADLVQRALTVLGPNPEAARAEADVRARAREREAAEALGVVAEENQRAVLDRAAEIAAKATLTAEQWATMVSTELAKPEYTILNPSVEIPAHVDDTVDAWKSGDELVPAPKAQLPELSDWQKMEMMATRLSRSTLIPARFFKKPDDLLIVLLEAHDLGLTTSMALSEVVIIEGKPAKSAYLLRYLVRRDGHRLWVDVEYGDHGFPVAGVARGSRRDDPTMTYEARFSVQQAADAGLCEVLDSGKVKARTSSGKKLPWELYTEDMLVARATSRLCRRAFEDSIGGAAYVPEELGFIEAEGTETAASGYVEPEPQWVDDLTRAGLQARLDALTPELRDDVKATWKKAMLPPLPKLQVQHLGPVEAIITAREAKMPDDAEIVEESHIQNEDVPAGGLAGRPVDELVDGPVDAATTQAYTQVTSVCEDCGVSVDNGSTHADGCPQAPM